MTETPYLDDSYRRTFEATVERRLGDRVVLDRTYFYPEGGGQPADHGHLAADGARWRVTDVRKKDTVYHTLEPADDGGTEGDAGADADAGTDGDAATGDEAGPDGHTDAPDAPAEGTTVEAELDWERRYAHMRYHTAQHLLSALLLAEYDARTTGNQLYADRARIDVEYDRFGDAELAAIEERMNELVGAAMPVRWYGMDRERAERELDTDRTRIDLLPDSIRELRIVEVGPEDDPYDRTACAGTHVENTEEVGTFRTTGRETKGSGEERLRFELDAD